MLSQELTDERDTEVHLQRLKSMESVVVRLTHWLVLFMMRLETTDRKDWQGFTRILEVLSLLDEIQQRSPQEIREAIEGFCDLPPNPGQTVSMEEVVFWAGIAAGMELRGYVEDGTVDEAVAGTQIGRYPAADIRLPRAEVVQVALDQVFGVAGDAATEARPAFELARAPVKCFPQPRFAGRDRRIADPCARSRSQRIAEHRSHPVSHALFQLGSEAVAQPCPSARCERRVIESFCA